MTTPLITLLSDFGLKDPYVAEMKAVISNVSPTARIIDITHSIAKFNVTMGAFVLASASKYFPKGTIHAAVVDPGVGTKRLPILIETSSSRYVGPDNGILILAAQNEGIKHVYKIANQRFMLPKPSYTFHGRDVFAPAAAHLANGVKPEKFGQELSRYEIPRFARISFRNNKLHGEVIHVDDFGNIITNITRKNLDGLRARLKETLNVKLKNTAINPEFCAAYGDVPISHLLALIDSHDFLEIAINQGSAAKELGIQVGYGVTVSR